MLIATVALLVSCGKESENVDTNASGSGNPPDSGVTIGAPTFAQLYNYLGQCNLDAIMSTFTGAGFTLYEENDEEKGNRRTVYLINDTCRYRFCTNDNGIVFEAQYYHNGDDQTRENGELRNGLVKMFEDEIEFTAEETLFNYHGWILNNGHETTYQSKESFIEAWKTIEFKEDIEVGSGCTYERFKTNVDCYRGWWMKIALLGNAQ